MNNSNTDTEKIVSNYNIANSDSQSNLHNHLKNENDVNELALSFVSKVSHQFRSPLTVIQTSIEILESFNDRLSVEEKENHYQTVYESISNLSELLDDVIMYCRSRTKTTKPTYKEIELIHYSKKIIEEIRTTFSKSPQINFYPKIEKLNITTDKKLFTQILSNLISNAIKYTPSNQNVEVSIERLNGTAMIEVRDYGIGIPEDERSKIFEPFFRARNTKGIAGSGLGLAIVQQVVNNLGGMITFISDEERGSMFTVKIPVNGKEG